MASSKKFLLTLFAAGLFLFPNVRAVNAQPADWGGECQADESTGIIQEGALGQSVGCRCAYQKDIPGKGRVEVKCPSQYICSTNEYNTSGYTVCLLKSGMQCGTAANAAAPFATAYDARCEGGGIVCDPSTQTCEVNQPDFTNISPETEDISQTIRRAINIMLGFLGIITVVMVIYGGFMWLTAAGSEEKISKGKHILLWAIIGAIVISIAWTITSYVLYVGRVVG